MSDESDVTPTGDDTYSLIRTILGSTERADRWHLTDEVQVLTALGRARFDLRGAVPTGSPVVEFSITCVLGSVNLLVPHGTLVVLDGTSFLASAHSHVAPGVSERLPRIEVTATTILGRVRVRSLDDEPVELVPADDRATGADVDPVDPAAETGPGDDPLAAAS